MCGITAYLGNESAFQYILDSLKVLQNRGYDSAGICTINNHNDFINHKYASLDNKSAIELLETHTIHHSNNNIGIGHTRWATHGSKTDTNAHPHFDSSNEICVVHNGIIENYLDIKNKLVNVGITFVSQTDTEVIPKLLEYYLRLELVRNNYNYNDINFENIIKNAINDLEGTWAIVILFKYRPNQLYLCKNGSPLVLGIDKHFTLISSESLSLSRYFNHYIALNDGDIITITKNNDGTIILPDTYNSYTQNIIQNKLSETTCYPYPHWTIKEIYEQPISIKNTLNIGHRILDVNTIKLSGLDSKSNILLNIKHIIVLGCGTSYNAGQIGCFIMKLFKCFTTVTCMDASEFTIHDIPNGCYEKTGFIMLSQSGETKDLHRCIETIRTIGCPIISIVNVVGSLIARESDCGIYLNAGREVGVASTKSFTSQVVALSLLTLWFSQNKNISRDLSVRYIKDLCNLSRDIENLLNNCSDDIKKLAKKLVEVKTIFILGRGDMKFIADEAALKIKEIAYIHAEGYAGGSLKHGTFALIDKNTVIILLAPKGHNFSKMINAAEEVHSRHSRIILITDSTEKTYNESLFESVITIPNNEYCTSVLAIIPLQLLAYEIALLKGHNPDYPKNLAKVVTVDG